MTCRFAQERLSALLEDDLGDTERLRVEEHLRGCGECRSALDEYRELVRSLRGFTVALPANLLRDFRERLGKETVTTAFVVLEPAFEAMRESLIGMRRKVTLTSQQRKVATLLRRVQNLYPATLRRGDESWVANR